MDIKDIIKLRREQLNLTLEDVARVVDVSAATVLRWENGEIKNLRRDKIAKLAQALKVSPAYLMGWEEEPTPELPKNIEPLPKMKKVPLLGVIACGEPILAQENFDGYVEVPDGITADFALRCHGDSMINARIMDGDLVFIRQQSDVDNGEIAAVLIDDEATLKRVYKSRNQIILQPENPKYPPMVYSGETLEDCRILGKAVAFLSAVR